MDLKYNGECGQYDVKTRESEDDVLETESSDSSCVNSESDSSHVDDGAPDDGPLQSNVHACGLPTSACKWTGHHLESIGLCYSSDVSHIDQIASLITNRELPVSKELPEIGSTLVELTEDILSVEFASFKCGRPRSHIDTSQDLKKLSDLANGFLSRVENLMTRYSGVLMDSTNFRYKTQYNYIMSEECVSFYLHATHCGGDLVTVL